MGPGDVYEMRTRDLERQEYLHPTERMPESDDCPDCFDRDVAECKRCDDTGKLQFCDACGREIAPGQEQVLPLNVDQPNSHTIRLCGGCATAEETAP